MKKIINKVSLIIVVAIIISSLSVVHAASNCSTELKVESKANTEGTVTVTLSLHDIVGDSNGDEITGATLKLEYDTDVFEDLTTVQTSGDTGIWYIKEAEEIPGWETPRIRGDRNIFLYGSSDESLDMMKIKLTIKDDAQEGETTIKIKDLVLTDGTRTIEKSEMSYIVTIGGSSTPQGVPNKNGGTDYGSVEDLYEETGKLEYSQEDKTTPEPGKPNPVKPDDGKPDPGKPDTIKPLKTGDIVLIVAGSIIAIVIIANIVQIIISKRKKQNK